MLLCGALFATLAKAGLRPGEALALQPDDVDLEGLTLHVERAVSLGEVKSTKTYEVRYVDLSPHWETFSSVTLRG